LVLDNSQPEVTTRIHRFDFDYLLNPAPIELSSPRMLSRFESHSRLPVRREFHTISGKIQQLNPNQFLGASTGQAEQTHAGKIPWKVHLRTPATLRTESEQVNFNLELRADYHPDLVTVHRTEQNSSLSSEKSSGGANESVFINGVE